MWLKGILLVLVILGLVVISRDVLGIAAVEEATKGDTTVKARTEAAGRNYGLYPSPFYLNQDSNYISDPNGKLFVFLERLNGDVELELVFIAFKWLTTGSITPYGVIVYASDHFFIGSGWVAIDASATVNAIRNFLAPETGAESMRQVFILKDAVPLGIFYLYKEISFPDFEIFLKRVKRSPLLLQTIEYAFTVRVFVFPSTKGFSVIGGSRFVVVNTRASDQEIAEFMCGKEMKSCKMPGQ